MKKISVRTMSMLAMLTAVTIVLARLCGFYITPENRISFEYFPIIFAGICFGPVAGAVVGGLADFLGSTVLSGLGFYPPLIVGPILAGLLSGLVARLVFHDNVDSWPKAAVVVFVSELLANLLWGSFALSRLYGSPFPVVLVGRIPVKLIVMVFDALFVSTLLKVLKPILKTVRRNA